MPESINLSCACGKTQMQITGKPIATVECCCTSCRTGAALLEALEGAPKLLTAHSTVPYVMIRKDRVDFVAGRENLAEFRLTPKSKTRRVIAICCNTPVFTEFQSGHWLSLNAQLWPAESLPAVELRTMAKDAPEGVTLPDDVPNVKTHNLRFFLKLFGAWAAMRFRSPIIPVANKAELEIIGAEKR